MVVFPRRSGQFRLDTAENTVSGGAGDDNGTRDAASRHEAACASLSVGERRCHGRVPGSGPEGGVRRSCKSCPAPGGEDAFAFLAVY